MKKILLLVIIINLFSCNYLQNNNRAKTYVRIVDTNGKPKKIPTFTPELNVEYLAEQKRQEFIVRNSKSKNLPNNNYKIPDLGKNLMRGSKINKIANNIDNNSVDLQMKSDIKSAVPKASYEEKKSLVEKGGLSKQDEKSSPIIYQISKEDIEKYDLAKNDRNNNVGSKKIKRGDLLIQIGSFANKSKASIAQKKSSIQNSKIISVKIGRKTYHKLVVGPFRDKKRGNISLSKLKKAGYRDAFYYRFN